MDAGAPDAAPRFWRAVVAALVAVGVGFRIWVVASPLGLVDGDEAVVGLMARRLLRGHAEAFFWGQEYGGAGESLLVAALLAVRVPGRWAMELVPIGLHAAAAVLVWRIGIRTIDRRGAALAAAVCWSASPALVWWSTKERGFYGLTLVCGLAVLLLVLRVAEPEAADRSVVDLLLLGLVAGLGWWSSPQILHFVVPAALWLLWAHRRRPRALERLVVVALPAFVVGALPWIWANAHTGLASLEPSADRVAFGDPLPIFFRYGLPMVLGLKAPVTLGWAFAGAKAIYVVVLAAIAVVLVARPARLAPVVLAVGLYPLLFALIPTTYYFGEPRYLDFLWPLLALLVGWGASRPRSVLVPVAAAVAAVAVTGLGLVRMVRLEAPRGLAFEDISPRPVAPVVALLDVAGVDRVFADYWVAYRLSWETRERVIATPLDLVRSPGDDAAVRDGPRSAFVVVRASCPDVQLREGLSRAGIPFVLGRADRWNVLVPERTVALEELQPEPC